MKNEEMLKAAKIVEDEPAEDEPATCVCPKCGHEFDPDAEDEDEEAE